MAQDQKTYQIALGHRYAIIQDGLRLNISKFSTKLRVVLAVSSAEELFKALPSLSTDLIVVGLDLPGYEGAAILQHLQGKFPDRRVAVLTAKEASYRECMKHDPAGFIMKRESAARIVRAIETIVDGTFYATPGVAEASRSSEAARGPSPAGEPGAVLSAREREMLLLVAEGLRNADIAERLGIRLRTVEFHKTNLKRKLQAKTSGELIRYAYEQKLL